MAESIWQMYAEPTTPIAKEKEVLCNTSGLFTFIPQYAKLYLAITSRSAMITTVKGKVDYPLDDC